MASKYIDPTAIMQVIGCVYNTPQLLDYTDKYTIVDEDFVEPFHKIVFAKTLHSNSIAFAFTESKKTTHKM